MTIKTISAGGIYNWIDNANNIIKREVGGAIFHYNTLGNLHSPDNDTPAIEFGNGHKMFYKNGVLHRDGDNPAIIFSNNTQKFYKDGKLHRLNGPAIEYSDNKKKQNKYFIDGIIQLKSETIIKK